MRSTYSYTSLARRACLYLAVLSLSVAAIRADPVRITMERAVQEALAGNPKLRAARSEAAATRAEAERDKPVARPRIAAEAQFLAQSPVVTFPRGDADAVVVPDRYGSLKLTVDQPIYRLGEGEAWRRYRAMVEAAERQCEVVDNDIIRDVRHAYVQALIARAMQKVAQEARDVAADHLALVKRMVEAGLSAPRDALAAEADLAEADEGLIKADHGLQLAKADLERLLGGKLQITADMLVEPEPIAISPSDTEAVAQALRHRPELIALRRGIEAAEAGHALAGLQSAPSLSLRASAAHQTPSAFASRNWVGIGIRAEWPIADGGKAASDAQVARARLDQLRAQLDEAEGGIRLEVRAALSRCATARARLDVCERRLTSAQAALAISRMRYEQRAATVLELASSRLAVTQADAALQQARLDRVLAWADLRHATAADIGVGTPQR